MKVHVIEGCISCGQCADDFPDLFRLNDAGLAESVGQVPPGREADARQAAEDCPVTVIVVEE